MTRQMPVNQKGKAATEEEPIQAIVLADSYRPCFSALLPQTPTCLLRICGKPLLAYTLDGLIASGVALVKIVTSEVDTMERFIEDYQKSAAHAKVHLDIVYVRAECTGDVLRELDVRGFKGDWLFLFGDVMANIDYKLLWDDHVRTRSRDKNLCLTVCLSQTGDEHYETAEAKRSRSRPVFGCAEPNKVEYWSMDRDRLSVPYDTLKESKSLLLQNNFASAQVYVISPDVARLFTDNFDWREIDTDFIKGLLGSIVDDKTVYVWKCEKYVQRADTTEAYARVTHDLVSRRVWPVVLEGLEVKDQARYIGEARLAKGAVVGRASVVLGGEVGESTILRSVLEKGVIVGDGCQIQDSFVWEDTKIGHECQIQSAIIAQRVAIGSHVRLGKGVLIGPDCQLADHTIVPPFTTLVCEGLEKDAIPNSKAYIQSSSRDHAEPESEAESQSDLSMSDSSDASEESSADEQDPTTSHLQQRIEDFNAECAVFLARAIEDDQSVADMQIELASLRMQQEVTLITLIAALAKSLFDFIQLKAQDKSQPMAILTRWLPLLANFMGDDEEQQVLVLKTIEPIVSSNQILQGLYGAILTKLYMSDIITEAGLARRLDHETCEDQSLHLLEQQMLQKLQEMSSDSESDSE